MRISTTAVVVGATLSASIAAWAQETMGCTKDTDCKGDRICVNGACTTPQPQYAPPPPPRYYAPPPPPAYYPPPPPRYRVVPYNPLAAAVSFSVGGESVYDSSTNISYGNLLLDGYGEVGARLTPNFSILGVGDLNVGMGGIALPTASIGGGFGFGRWNRLTLGAGFDWVGRFGPGVMLMAHLSLPLSQNGFGLHLGVQGAWTDHAVLGGLTLGFGYSR